MLAPVPIQGGGLLLYESFPQGVRDHGRRELIGDGVVLAGGETGVEPVLLRDQSALRPRSDGRLPEGLEEEVGEHVAAPQRGGALEPVRRQPGIVSGLCREPLTNESIEFGDVESVVRSGNERVAGGDRSDPSRGRVGRVTEQCPQLADVDLQRLARACDGGLAPHTVDERLDADRIRGVHRQHGEDTAQLPAADGYLDPVVVDDERAEEPDFHDLLRSLWRRFTVVCRYLTGSDRPGLENCT